MRTRALVIAAAISAAGIVASLAQSNVYSVNVVGYYNLNLTNQPYQNLIANQLDLDGTGNNNTVQTVFGNPPSGGGQWTVQAFNGTGFDGAGFSTKSGWSGNTAAVNAALKPGNGVFVAVQTATTLTVVGNVMQGVLNTDYPASAYKIVSSQVPQAGKIQTDLGLVPVTGDQLTIQQFNPATQNYIGGGWAGKTGWSTGGNPGEPTFQVGEAFYIFSSKGGTWSRNFTVQ